jgi:hypothetical protein
MSTRLRALCVHTAVLRNRISAKFSRTEINAIVITQDYSNFSARAIDLNLNTRCVGHHGWGGRLLTSVECLKSEIFNKVFPI